VTRLPILMLIANEARGIAVVASTRSAWWPLVSAHPITSTLIAWAVGSVVFVAIWPRIPRS
jgi:hypothetical protein